MSHLCDIVRSNRTTLNIGEVAEWFKASNLIESGSVILLDRTSLVGNKKNRLTNWFKRVGAELIAIATDKREQ